QAAGLDGVRIDDYVDEHVGAEGLADPEEDAVVVLLIGEGAGILLHDEPDFPFPYMDGRHRVAAQLDQGVAETVVQRFETLDPATGRPAADRGRRPSAEGRFFHARLARRTVSPP